MLAQMKLTQHGTYSINWCFLPFSNEMVLKTSIFQMLPEIKILKLKIPDFVKC